MSLAADPEFYDAPPTTWSAQDTHPEEPETPNPLAGLLRGMRGRWGLWFVLCVVFGGSLGALGYLNGTQTYDSTAILRVYPKEAGILYTSDDSVLKTFDKYVKAETAFVASQPVMERATQTLLASQPVLAQDMTIRDLRGSVQVKRSESLIVLKTTSKDAGFAQAKLAAVTDAYFALMAENRSRRAEMRTVELVKREAELLEALQELGARSLKVGGEYGLGAMAKAHVEKIGQIDALATRKAEVERTLINLRQEGNSASADMNDEHILRATLLDRGLADLNIEIARHKAELGKLKTRYKPSSRLVIDKQDEIAILEQAQAERRQQIQILGQTGALTDQSDGGEEDSLGMIETLFAKVSEELEAARAEARGLNARRVELAFLEEEREELRDMLEDTRAALDRIRVESTNDRPGLTELMAPADFPAEPSEDSSKMQGAMGVAVGGLLGSMIVMGMALLGRRVRWSDGLGGADQGLPLLSVMPAASRKTAGRRKRAIDRLRTTIQLLPERGTPSLLQAQGSLGAESARHARCLCVLRSGPGMTHDNGKGAAADTAQGLAQDLAESFAQSGLSVLLVTADLTAPATREPGWRDLLSGAEPTLASEGGLTIMPAGQAELDDTALSLQALRQAIARLSPRYDVIILAGGNPLDTVSAELFATVSDFVLGQVRRSDDLKLVSRATSLFAGHARHGAGLVFDGALRKDPNLAV